VKLSRYDALIGYLHKDADFYLRHYSVENPKYSCCDFFGLGRLVGNVVYRFGGKH
jgi:hypothetical protein